VNYALNKGQEAIKMANTFDIQKITHIGDFRMTITQVTGDGSTTAITATELGLAKIRFAWLQDIDDGAALGIASITTDTLTLSAAIGNTQNQYVFALGW
jgi:hypothetical protein